MAPNRGRATASTSNRVGPGSVGPVRGYFILITATAMLTDNPFSEAKATFDVRDCTAPRTAVVELGPRLTVDREGDDG